MCCPHVYTTGEKNLRFSPAVLVTVHAKYHREVLFFTSLVLWCSILVTLLVTFSLLDYDYNELNSVKF